MALDDAVAHLKHRRLEPDSSLTVSIRLRNELARIGVRTAFSFYGNDGANVLDGKGGNDLLVGLMGADMFAFTTAPGAGNVDVVFGFEHGVDRIAPPSSSQP